MKLAVVGGQDFEDYKMMYDILDVIEFSVLVSSGAKGADYLSEVYADHHKIPKEILYPDYAQYGRSAAFKRNSLIVEAADKVLAFWDHKSNGTGDTISKARKAGKLLGIHYYATR
jgi:hypothetical protein